MTVPNLLKVPGGIQTPIVPEIATVAVAMAAAVETSALESAADDLRFQLVGRAQRHVLHAHRRQVGHVLVKVFHLLTELQHKEAQQPPAVRHLRFFQNATTQTWRSKNPSNALNKGPLAFFSIKAANSDCTDHLKANWENGKLVLGCEDMTKGGDRDYNDAVIGASGLVNPQNVFTYQAKASDVDGDKLTYSLLEAPSGAKIDAQTGLLTWEKPVAGTWTFRIQVDDGKGGKAEQCFTVTFKKPSDAGKSACISLTSVFHCGEDCDKDEDRYIAINQGKDRQCAMVDWDGCAPNLGKTKEDDWVADYFAGNSKEKSLAELTGLKVRVVK